MCLPSGKDLKHWLTRVAIYGVFKTANPDCVTQAYFHTQQLNVHHSYASNVLCFHSGLWGANSEYFHYCMKTMISVIYKADLYSLQQNQITCSLSDG